MVVTALREESPAGPQPAIISGRGNHRIDVWMRRIAERSGESQPTADAATSEVGWTCDLKGLTRVEQGRCHSRGRAARRFSADARTIPS